MGEQETVYAPVAEVIPPSMGYPYVIPAAPDVPWYHETAQAKLFNEWTWTHFAWGMVSAGMVRTWWQALLLHTVYEAVEGQVFPSQHRDVSMRNHVGDTVAFMAGRWAMEIGRRK